MLLDTFLISALAVIKNTRNDISETECQLDCKTVGTSIENIYQNLKRKFQLITLLDTFLISALAAIKKNSK